MTLLNATAVNETLSPNVAFILASRCEGAMLDGAEMFANSADGELEFDGLVLPRRLNGHGAVQHVLSQRRGRLRAKDLRAAVADKRHRDELAEREIEEIEREASDATLGRVAEAMDALPGGGAHGAHSAHL